MTKAPNRFELIGYLEEALDAEDMSRIEEELRTSSQWRVALSEVRDGMDFGEHSVATIWRRHRLTCPSRERLGAFLVGGLVPDEEDYVRFHLELVKCRWCNANLADLQASACGERETEGQSAGRRRRFFESSVGYLPDRDR